MMVRPLMDTPRSITATSSKVLALKLIPASQFLPGDHTVRINAPSMIASTSASSQARPNGRASRCSSAVAAIETAMQSAVPGMSSLALWRNMVGLAGIRHPEKSFAPAQRSNI